MFTEKNDSHCGTGFDSSFVRKLMPHRQRMVLLDSIVSYDGTARSAIGVRLVAQNDPLLEGHFPEDPIFPPCLLIEALAQVSGFLMNVEYLVRRHGIGVQELLHEGFVDRVDPPPMTVLAESKMRNLHPVRPGSEVRLHTRLVLSRGDVYYYQTRAVVAQTTAMEGEILLAYPPYGNGPTASGV